MHKSLALCLITSKADEEKAKQLAASLSKYAKAYITVTGTKEQVEKGEADFEWTDDFSAARNYNFSLAKEDWILWLDADDSLEGDLKLLQQLIDQADERKLEGFFFRYEYAFNEHGKCIDEHWKAQLLKNNGHFKWMGQIHEDPIQLRQVSWAKVNGIKRVHHSDDNRVKNSYERNLRILLKSAELNPKEPRTHFYLGRTYMATGELTKAIEEMVKYLDLSGWDDERYEATLIIGRCYQMANDYENAIRWYHEAILEQEKYPDAYMSKGAVYLIKGEFEKALYNFGISLKMDKPEGMTFYNPSLYACDIFVMMATCYVNLGRLTEALQAIKTALRYDDRHERANELYKLILSVKTKNDIARKYVEIAQYINKTEGVQKLLTSVPAELRDNEFILSLNNTFNPPKSWPEKSIAIYCGQTVEPWSDGTQDKGIGGSETAVIELSKRLASLGWQVTVFNYCDAPPEGFVKNGVRWMNYWTFNIKDNFDVVWLWRIPELLDYDISARLRVLDMHDTMRPADFSKERVQRVDKIFVKTKFHRSLYPDVPDNKFVIIPNGIDLAKFKASVKKDPNRFCYTSSPSRGLDVLLKMWPKIREQLPKAELHVYYGWKTFYELEKKNPERMMWMKKVQAMMNQPGVIDHGRVGQTELAKDLLKTSFWLYPTDFPEIDCITAKEMQAAGVYPITTGYAALEESQLGGVKLPGDVHSPEWQERFVKTVTEEYNKQHQIINVSKFAWDNIAKEWDKQLYEKDNKKETN